MGAIVVPFTLFYVPLLFNRNTVNNI